VGVALGYTRTQHPPADVLPGAPSLERGFATHARRGLELVHHVGIGAGGVIARSAPASLTTGVKAGRSRAPIRQRRVELRCPELELVQRQPGAGPGVPSPVARGGLLEVPKKIGNHFVYLVTRG